MSELSRLLEFFGSLGLFLLGMIIMTGGLKDLAGESMRKHLMYFTRSPATGALSGTVCTAILQSSSAVTVATVGFVSAGLMTFSHSLGVIFGANIGTTLTGWLVLLFGFKIKLGLAALPLIFVGAVLKLFGNPKWAALGFSLAGFGLLFVGIASLQDAMAGMRAHFDFSTLPMDNAFQVIVVVVFGVIFTLVTQSSSAGVAATLTALYSGVIHFPQAAALVIGMDIGTTVTAALATTGASLSARRTGFSHVIYNLLTGTTAIFLIFPYIGVWQWLFNTSIEQHGEVALIAFHSLFNILGVSIALPFTRQFTILIKRLFPSAATELQQQLDSAILSHPEEALNRCQKVLWHYQQKLVSVLHSILTTTDDVAQPLQQINKDLEEIGKFIDEISVSRAPDPQRKRLMHLIHVFDHLQRLQERLEDYNEHTNALHKPALKEVCTMLTQCTQHYLSLTSPAQLKAHCQKIVTAHQLITANAPTIRAHLLNQIVNEQLDIPNSTMQLDTLRWYEHISRHLKRIAEHYTSAIAQTGQ